MRGNSKYLRWAPLYTCCCVLVIISSIVIGVPVRPRRMVRETYLNLGVNYTSAQKPEVCLKDGNEVDKSTVQCDIKTGCRVIQKTGECCPEYQCDCTRDEKIYKNGEKITDPDIPCHVCVCKGGELTCQELSCYTRADCEPRHVSGTCCPVYDNCPILENVQLVASKESNSKEITKKNTVRQSINSSAVSSTTTENQLILNAENPLGIKIKEITKPEEIRITDDKPKLFKPTKSVISSKELLNPTTPILLPSPVPTPTTPIDEEKNISEDTNQTVKSIQSIEENEQSTEKQIDSSESDSILHLGIADVNALGDGSSNKSVRQANKNTSDSELSLENDENLSSVNSTDTKETESNDVTSTPNPNSEETSSPSSTSDPSVVRVGNDVVIVKDSVNITLKGAAGLQQGEDSETDENRKHENDVGVTTVQTLDKASQIENETISRSSEEILNLGPQDLGTTEPEPILGSAVNSAELVSAMSSDELTEGSRRKFSAGNIGEKSSKSNKNDDSGSFEVIDSNESSTDNATDKPTDISEQVFETVYYYTTKGPLNTIAFEPRYYGSTSDGSIEGSSSPYDDDLFGSTSDAQYSTAGIGSSEMAYTSSPTVESSSRFLHEEEEIIPNENPEFPELPEDFSVHHALSEEEAKKRVPSKIIAEEPHLTTIGPIDDTKPNLALQEFSANSIPKDSSTTIGPTVLEKSSSEAPISETLRLELVSSTSGPDTVVAETLKEEDALLKDSHKSDNIQERSPGEPLLIPEWERTTTETDESVVTNFDNNNSSQLQNNSILNENDTISKVSLSNESNQEKTEDYKLTNELNLDEQKEATTEQLTTKISANLVSEIDSTSSSTDHYDPDEDAESIKFHDSSEDNIFDAKFIEKPSFLGFDFIADYIKLQQKNWDS